MAKFYWLNIIAYTSIILKKLSSNLTETYIFEKLMKRSTRSTNVFSKIEAYQNFLCLVKSPTFLSVFLATESLGFLDTFFFALALILLFATVCEAQLYLGYGVSAVGYRAIGRCVNWSM